jgi:multiple sugar transport system permease protein
MTTLAEPAVLAAEKPRASSRSDTPTWRFTAPLVAVLAATTVVPIGYAVYLSFFDWNWGSRFRFVGLHNYAVTLTNAEFWGSIGRTASFTVMALAIELVAGLALALAVDRLTRGVGWLRTLFILPLMMSGIVVSMVWKVMLDPTLGVVPWFLRHLGLSAVNLLGNPSTALPTLAFLDAWWQSGFVFIILYAGVQSLPKEPFEAAEVDGAGYWSRFRYLTLPLLLPLIAVVAAVRAVDCFKLFDLVFGATNGGPGTATQSLQMLAYRTAFKGHQMSASMTMLVVYTLFVMIAVIVALGLRRVVGRRAGAGGAGPQSGESAGEA